MYGEQSDSSETAKPNAFKDYEPGYLHVDIKYLPNIPDDTQKRYLLVGIDRATRWAYMEVVTNKTAAKFIKSLAAKYPVHIKAILTDYNPEFISREFTDWANREPPFRTNYYFYSRI